MSANRYWAFISYTHADEAVATWLHRALETYRLPRKLVGTAPGGIEIPARLFPVFRDRDELASSNSLTAQIEQALVEASALIVVASRASARSHWVDQEIRAFKALGKERRVFCVIVDGEPFASGRNALQDECFAPALRFDVDAQRRLTSEPAEPIAADIRPGKDGRRDALLKLVAGVLELGLDALKQRDLQRRQRRLALIAGASLVAAMFTTGLSVVAVQARNEAEVQRALADKRRTQAEGLIQFMLGDLRDRLEPIGKLDLLDAVGNEAMEYFASLDASDHTDAALSSRATALRQIGHVRVKQGQFAAAAEAFNEALEVDTELAVRHPDDAELLYNVGETQFAQGNASYLKGDFDEAMRWFDAYRRNADRLMAMEPENRRWQQVAVEAGANIGVLRFRNDEIELAIESLTAARERQKTLLAADPKNPEYLNIMSMVHGWLSLIARKQQRWDIALGEAQQQSELIRRLLADAPGDARYREQLVHALHHIVGGLLRLGRLRPDSRELQEVLALSGGLSDGDPQNIEYARAHALSLFHLSEAHLIAGDNAAAARALDASLALSRSLYQRAPENLVLVDDLLERLAHVAWLSYLRGDSAGAAALLDEANAVPLTPKQRDEISADCWLKLHLLGWRIADSDALRTQYAAAAEQIARLQPVGAAPEWMFAYWVSSGDELQAAAAYRRLAAGDRQLPIVRNWCTLTRVCAG